MNNEKQVNSSAVKTVLIVILTILLIASLSFTAYDKLINENKNKTEQNNNAEENNNSNNAIEDNQSNNQTNFEEVSGMYYYDLKMSMVDEDTNETLESVIGSNTIELTKDGQFYLSNSTLNFDIKLKGKYTINGDKIVLNSFEFQDKVNNSAIEGSLFDISLSEFGYLEDQNNVKEGENDFSKMSMTLKYYSDKLVLFEGDSTKERTFYKK